jgi:hypothetical protein
MVASVGLRVVVFLRTIGCKWEGRENRRFLRWPWHSEVDIQRREEYCGRGSRQRVLCPSQGVTSESTLYAVGAELYLASPTPDMGCL